MNKLRIFASIITIAALAIITLRMDLSGLQQSLSRISWKAACACIALVQIQIALSALRWQFTSRRLHQDITPWKAIREYYVASLLNQILPGGMGGDALRAWRMRSGKPGGWKEPAKAVIFERLSGQIAFFLLALIGVSIWPFTAHADPVQNPLHYLFFGTATFAAILSISVWALRRGAMSALGGSLFEVFIRDKAWLFHALMSVSILFTYVATFFIAAQATGSDLPFVASLTIIPFCLVAMLIPTGFGGWGTREAAAMALWPMLGASAVDGLAASITYGWVSLAGAAPGVIFLVVSTLRNRPSRV